MIYPLISDKLFKDSPNAGDVNCICSRCGEKIKEREVPVRCWETDEKGDVTKDSREYRYCTACQQKAGIKHSEQYLYDLENDHIDIIDTDLTIDDFMKDQNRNSRTNQT